MNFLLDKAGEVNTRIGWKGGRAREDVLEIAAEVFPLFIGPWHRPLYRGSALPRDGGRSNQ